MNRRVGVTVILLAGLALVASCMPMQPTAHESSSSVALPDSVALELDPPTGSEDRSVDENRLPQDNWSRQTVEPEEQRTTLDEVRAGTGSFINRRAARDDSNSAVSTGDIVLNFEASDILEVVGTLLGEILGVNYAVDPGVSGKVTLTTSRPIGLDAVLPTLETILRINGAVLKVVDGVYTVVPEAKALAHSMKPSLKPAAQGGFQILIVPLRYVGAKDMEKILTPLFPSTRILLSDTQRNHLMIAGTESELEHALETVAIFDVNQMQGMSVGLFSLQSAEARIVRAELEEIMGTELNGPLAGLIKFVTIDRLNALIVISPQSQYLETAQSWIEKLDIANDVSSRSMHVYAVQNGRAESLAQLLSELFAGRFAGASTNVGGSGDRSPSPTRGATGAPRTGDNGLAAMSDIRIIADEENNALVVLATPAEFTQIRTAIRKLDIVPLQVLVEATIVEVSLTDEFSYGLQWFFKNGIGDKDASGQLFPLTVDPSFSYSVATSAGQVRAVLNLLAANSRLNVISSPSLMVLDNRTATIRVGDQVPIRTSETTSLATSGSDALITSTIQYRDTGVLLEVTPRVSQGGMVTLEISQDVNDVDQTTTSEIDSPTIIQRTISTSVAVQSGETVVLGGLIRENKSESEAGIPGLRRIPGIGRLFGSRLTNTTRTELLVLITPTAVTSLAEAREATQEMKRKMPTIN